MAKQYRLCYLDGEYKGFLYFTDNFDNQWGDDWNDAPYNCNADEPYEYCESMDKTFNASRGHIRKFGFDLSESYAEVQDRCLSVEEINKLGYPWIYCSKSKTGIKGGDGIRTVVKWCRENGIKIGELK